jgi:hypothetical protein
LEEPSSIFAGGRVGGAEPAERAWSVYGAATDTCEVGRGVAPEHVLYGDAESDGHGGGQEFLFRQPRSRVELLRVLLGSRATLSAGGHRTAISTGPSVPSASCGLTGIA